MSDLTRDTGASPDVDFVPIASFPEPMLLPQAHALLDEAGIAYVVENEGVQNLVGIGSAVFGFNPAVGAPLLCVEPARFEEARALLEPLFAPPPAQAPTLALTPAECPTCHRTLESEPGDPPLAVCYHCGASLVPGEGSAEPTVLAEPVAGSELARIADQLRRAMRGEAWHGSSLRELLDGVTAAQAAAHPVPGAHSIGEIVLHVAAWRDAVRMRLAGKEVRPADEQDWPPLAPGDAAWSQANAVLERSTELLVDALARESDAQLDEPILPGFSTRYVTLHGVVQHDLYHAGQIALLRKALTAGPPSVLDS